MKASEMTAERNISMLLKGTFGFGKTLAASSACVEGPIYIAYWDKKKPIELEHFYKRVIKRPELLKNIEFDVYGSHNAHEYLNKLIDFTKDCRFVAVITDSVTNLTAGAVNWSLGFRDPRGAKKDKMNQAAPQLIPDFDEYKVETSLVSQALDISRTLPCHIIWTAHPLPQLKVEGAGASIKVSKSNSIVTYGSKVAGIVPGNFTEIYHFSKMMDYQVSPSRMKYIVSTDMVGDDYAKTALGLPTEFEITNRLFWEVWKEELKKVQDTYVLATNQEQNNNDVTNQSINPSINPFTNKQTAWKT